MPYPQSEQLPNGTPSIFALKDPRWLKLLSRSSVAPSEDDQGPQVLSRPVSSQQPDTQQPIAPPALTPAMNQDAPVERPRSFDKLDPLEKIAIKMRPDPNQPIASAGPQVDVAQPINVPNVPWTRDNYQAPEIQIPANAPPAATGYTKKNQRPAIGEEDANTTRYLDRLNANGGYTSSPQPSEGYYGTDNQSPAGEQTIRPYVADKLGYAENHVPMPRHGRFVEALKGAGLGFLRGVSATGTIGGGLGGAATLGTMSAIKPEYAEAAQNQMFTIPKLQQQEAIRVGRNEQALKQAGQVADINVKRAQADEATARAGSLRNPKPTTFKGADGLEYEYDANAHTAKPIAGQGRARAKVLRTVERSGKVWYETDDGLQPALDPKTGQQLEEELVPVTLPGGATVKVKPAEAARLSSMFANHQATAQEQEAFKQYGVNLKGVRDRNKQKEQQYTQAVKAGEDFNKRHEELDKMYADAQSLSEKINSGVVKHPEDVQKLSALNGQLPGLKARLNAEAQRLTEQYGGHIRYNEQERFEPLSSGPELEDDPELPALNVGGGPQVGSARQGRISRQNFGKFREQNPQFKDKSDAEIENVLKGQGYEIY